MLDAVLKELLGYGITGLVSVVAILALVRVYSDAKAERERNREAETALSDRMVAKAETYALKAMETNDALRLLVEKQEERLEREKMERERLERVLAKGGRDG